MDKGTENKVIVEFCGARLGYGRNVVLGDVSFRIHRGDFLGIIGPNGAGKTTILRAIVGLIRPLTGRVLTSEGLRYGYVMQRQSLDTLFPFTVADVVRMGRLGQSRGWGRITREDAASIEQALAVAGIHGLRNHLYRELSRGQRQRTLIARALAAQPDVLLLDEPTNDMDAAGENQIMGLVQEVQRDTHVTIVLVSHLLHVVLNYAERLLFLTGGRAYLHSVEELVSNDLLSTIYGFPIRVGESGGKKYLLAGE